MKNSAAINAYKTVGIESSVTNADPHKLISLLFEGALLAITEARGSMMRDEISAKGAAISRAIAIIGQGLHASLDMKAGGELAQKLASLYDYMVGRLVHANANNDMDALDEVARLLGSLQEAWDSIRPTGTTPHQHR